VLESPTRLGRGGEGGGVEGVHLVGDDDAQAVDVQRGGEAARQVFGLAEKLGAEHALVVGDGGIQVMGIEVDVAELECRHSSLL